MPSPRLHRSSNINDRPPAKFMPTDATAVDFVSLRSYHHFTSQKFVSWPGRVLVTVATKVPALQVELKSPYSRLYSALLVSVTKTAARPARDLKQKASQVLRPRALDLRLSKTCNSHGARQTPSGPSPPGSSGPPPSSSVSAEDALIWLLLQRPPGCWAALSSTMRGSSIILGDGTVNCSRIDGTWYHDMVSG